MRRIHCLASLAMAATTTLSLTACGADADGATAVCGGKDHLTAGGSITQERAIAVFEQAWRQTCPDKRLSYVDTGSGDGRQRFVARQFDFAGSDAPLSAEQIAPATQRCAGNPAWNLPLVINGVVLVYSLDGVPNLVVTGDVLARIFNGTVTNWDHPMIAALNPSVALPSIPIVPVFRQDGAGVTNEFQKYLAAVAPKVWTQGTGSEFLGNTGIGAEHGLGVINAVRATPGAIGYIEMDLMRDASLPTAWIDSGQGAVAATPEALTKAVDGAEFLHSEGDLAINMNSLYRTREPEGYPIVQLTYEIVCLKGYDTETALAVKSFLSAAATSGQTGLPAVDSVPLPRVLRLRLLDVVALIS